VSFSVSDVRKAIGLAVILAWVAAPALSQAAPASPVHWTFSSRKINAATYELHMTATIDSGWHIYSLASEPDDAVPTSFQFAKNPTAAVSGAVKEVGRVIKADDTGRGYKVPYYEDKVDFVQLVSRRGNAPTTMKGTVVFMAVGAKTALPPKQMEFAIPLN
jgi:hypothetical protein